MRILLFITSIYNTLDNDSKENYNKLINTLEKIKELNNDDIIYISFCDTTENRNIIISHLRKMIHKIEDKTVYPGNQFLGDVYYKYINGGAILYKDKKFNKLNEIINYVKELENEGNQIDLIVSDGNMNINEYEEKLKQELTCPYSFIYNANTIEEVIDCLESIYDVKQKKLQLTD